MCCLENVGIQIGEQNETQTAGEPAGIVLNIMRFCLHDGPGIRTTVFLKGCPLSCWWCHNPESQSPKPALMYLRERCRLCGDCILVCPRHAISRGEVTMLRSAACAVCGACVDACLAGARAIAGRRMTVSEVVAEIERDTVFFDESGGGVTFSGGEPLSQPVFLDALLEACRRLRIHTVLDTCGLAEPRSFSRIASKADLVLYDLKLLDAERHRACTGGPNEPIVANLEGLARAGRPVVVRVPVVPGVNDSDAEFAAILLLLRRLGLNRIDLLPYHKIGIDKYARLNLKYQLPAIEPPAAARMQQLAGALGQQGFIVRIGG